MYKMDDEAVSKLTSGLKKIVRDARTIMENPDESHNRLENIVDLAQKQLENLKEGKYRTKATQRMRKPNKN